MRITRSATSSASISNGSFAAATRTADRCTGTGRALSTNGAGTLIGPRCSAGMKRQGALVGRLVHLDVAHQLDAVHTGEQLGILTPTPSPSAQARH